MVYILVNDIHLSDRAPSSCTDTYLDDLFDLLEQVRDLTRSRNDVTAVVLAGDVFHHKTPSRTSHATVMRLIRWAERMRASRIDVYTVLGNHDLSHDRVASIDETQPLGVCIASGRIKLLDGWIDNGDPVYGVPWQMTWDATSVNDALLSYRQGIDLADPTLVVTHAPLYPPGHELPYEYFPALDWAGAMGGHGTVHYGHVHSPHGIYTVDGVTFSNCGALSRGSLNENNLTRPVQVAIWDSQTGQIEHINLRHKPAAEVFRLPEIAVQRAAQVDLSSFLGSVDQTQLSITSTESVVEHIRTLGLAPDLETLLKVLLEEASQ